MQVDLIQILEKTVSPNQQELQNALQFLESAAQQNFPEYLRQLSMILRDTSCGNVARMQAGLQLKNALYSKDPGVRSTLSNRWLAIPLEARGVIKENVLHSLGTELTRPSSAAQCVAQIACIELPLQTWAGLIETITSQAVKPDAPPEFKQAALEAIGYMCQDMEQGAVLQAYSGHLLTAIVSCMHRDNENAAVKLVAVRALYNSLEYCSTNFEQANERNYLMEHICHATQCTGDTNVQIAALQCLVKIVSLYYEHLEPYMAPALFPISRNAMMSQNDGVALQGIEFWSSICEEEQAIQQEWEEAQEENRPPDRTSMHYARGALPYIVPQLLERLKQQDATEEEEEDDEWRPNKAAGVCLMLLAQTVADEILGHVLPFVQANIQSSDWRCRDAAVMAFGSCLEGPDPDKLKTLAGPALPLLVHLLNDQSVTVRDTAAWAVGRVCEVCAEAASGPQVLPSLVEGLLGALKMEPRVATNAAWALSSLAQGLFELATAGRAENAVIPTYPLSPYFERIVQELLAATERADAGQGGGQGGDSGKSNLRVSAFEALMELVKNSPDDCSQTVYRTTAVILERLRSVLAVDKATLSSAEARQQYEDLQSQLCAALQSVVKRLPADARPHYCDLIMQALLGMIANNPQSTAVREDAFFAITGVSEVLGSAFVKYMQALLPFLTTAIHTPQTNGGTPGGQSTPGSHIESPQVSIAAVGLVGDLTRALGEMLLLYTHEIMASLMALLSDPYADRSVKPHVLSALGDIALALGTKFEPFLPATMLAFQQAASTAVALAAGVNAQSGKEPSVSAMSDLDFLNELRENCLQAYTGVVQGLKGPSDRGDPTSPALVWLQPHVDSMIQLLESVGQSYASGDESQRSDECVQAACGLAGDLLTTFGVGVLPLLNRGTIAELLKRARHARQVKTKQLAQWTWREMKKLEKQFQPATA